MKAYRRKESEKISNEQWRLKNKMKTLLNMLSHRKFGEFFFIELYIYELVFGDCILLNNIGLCTNFDYFKINLATSYIPNSA